MGPAEWLDQKLLSPATDWTLRREAVAVTDGIEGSQRAFYIMVGRWVLMLVGVCIYPHLPEGGQDALFVAMMIILAIGTMSGWNRALAYKRGWQEGRRRMIEHFPTECRHVDPRIENWLDAERNFDAVHVMGLPPSLPPHPDQ